MSDIKKQASDAMDTAQEQVGEAGDSVKEHMGDLKESVGDAQNKASPNEAGEGREKLSDKLRNIFS